MALEARLNGFLREFGDGLFVFQEKSVHEGAYQFIARMVRDLPPRTAVVEIGARNVNGTIRDLFEDAEYTGVDTIGGAGVDVVMSGADFEPPSPVDTVVCCETLEHTDEAAGICRAAYRALVSGGVFLMTCATGDRDPHSAIDGGTLHPGEFYHNVSEAEIRKWCSDFSEVYIEVDERAGDLYVRAIR